MGEGACVLVLESMEHAQARGAHIYAEVVGYGNTDDAYHITSPDPDAAGIARAISLAVAEGDVKPSEGLYINAHGTSTKLNDSSETTGIKRALGEDAARAAHVSSTKSMTRAHDRCHGCHRGHGLCHGARAGRGAPDH